MFFSFLAVFPLPESYQNDPKFHFNTLLRSDTQKSSKNVENTTVFWSRCETVFGVWSRCETVFGPPPAKADIATVILTNVIEHLVLLLPPNKHAFTAKAVWADFVICMNNSRNRSPLRIFQYLPISATFVQCGQRRPSWTMHVNSKISSGALSGMKRLIDEIRSFKCVCVWWLSGEVEHFVHLIRWNLKAVLCPCGWLEHGPGLAQRTTFRFRSWILSLINCFGFLACH